MKRNENAKVSLRKILSISLVVIIFLGIVVFASNTELNSVKIKFSNNHEITILTSKTKVSEILDENHIILASNEVVVPGLDEEITGNKTIKISIIGTKEAEVIETAEESDENNIDIIKQKYENIKEEIVTVTEEIPFETITKDVSNGDGSPVNRVVQAGKNGLRETTYKITYQNDVEITRVELESKIIKESVNKIVEVQKRAVTSRSGSSRSGGVTTATSGTYKVTAYCACVKCCGKTNGITASGKKATANHTIAAPSSFAFGTQIVMNGKTYTVEDRGGAIQGNKIDLYVNSHSEALRWGVRYLNVEVIN